MVVEIRRQFKEILDSSKERKASSQIPKPVWTFQPRLLFVRWSDLVLRSRCSSHYRIRTGTAALGGMLAGSLVTGVLMALFMANAGGAWDNAKKAIEQDHIPGAKKGDDAHDAAVIGDTIGDPFKDTSGPSLNILIKLMSIVAVVLAGTGKLTDNGLL